ncbi:MAG: hypothetical protein LAO31_15795 [Acidobacteriia bacterium]|nr:hypothetical protein [Terriglobia bacterium]
MKNNWKALLICTAVVALVLLMGTSTFAATQTLTINATVAARAELTLAPTTINFADASPATSPNITANTPVTVTANVRTAKASTATLMALAGTDLTSGTDTIPITAVTWTASALPFIAGTMSHTSAQSGATFSAGSGSYSGTYTFTLANSWSYNTGSYVATVTYTLTAP